MIGQTRPPRSCPAVPAAAFVERRPSRRRPASSSSRRWLTTGRP